MRPQNPPNLLVKYRTKLPGRGLWGGDVDRGESLFNPLLIDLLLTFLPQHFLNPGASLLETQLPFGLLFDEHDQMVAVVGFENTADLTLFHFKDRILKLRDKTSFLEKPQIPAGYVVQEGDTLQSIAKKLYRNADRWVEIYEMNSDRIERGGTIRTGQFLVLPQK